MLNDEFIIDIRRHERLDVRPRGLSRLYIGCDKDPCNGAGVSSFEVLGTAAAVSQPREGFFDDRGGADLEVFGYGGTLVDLEAV